MNKHLIIISSSVISIIAIIALSIFGLVNYQPNTLPAFPYIPPPAGERQNYYLEANTNDFWKIFFSPYSSIELARIAYLGQSFIFKNFVIRDYTLDQIFETYLLYNSIKFVPRNPSELQKLKEGDKVDITGVCSSLDERNEYVIMGNCQFLPAGTAPLPLPGGSALISPGY